MMGGTSPSAIDCTPPEIWAKVIAHLYRTPPPPNGKNEPASIRQGDLAVAMRVNKVSVEHVQDIVVSFFVMASLASGTARGMTARGTWPSPA